MEVSDKFYDLARLGALGLERCKIAAQQELQDRAVKFIRKNGYLNPQGLVVTVKNEDAKAAPPTVEITFKHECPRSYGKRHDAATLVIPVGVFDAVVEG